MILKKNDQVPLAGGGMTLQIGWLHHLEKNHPVSGCMRLKTGKSYLYPGAIEAEVEKLRKHSERAQILITTQSPLVLNGMRPEEVTLVRRDPTTNETVFLPMTRTPNLAERLRVYALGELWVSYLDTLWEELPSALKWKSNRSKIEPPG
jgi:hypothetical protein